MNALSAMKAWSLEMSSTDFTFAKQMRLPWTLFASDVPQTSSIVRATPPSIEPRSHERLMRVYRIVDHIDLRTKRERD